MLPFLPYKAGAQPVSQPPAPEGLLSCSLPVMVRIFYLSFDGVHQIGRRRRVAILCVAAKQRPDFREMGQ
jgi:hypothetical protein